MTAKRSSKKHSGQVDFDWSKYHFSVYLNDEPVLEAGTQSEFAHLCELMRKEGRIEKENEFATSEKGTHVQVWFE